MKLTSLSKSVRTILGMRGYCYGKRYATANGLIIILSAIQGMSLLQTAQAQSKPQTGSVCTAAYFDNPGYMYQAETKEQQEAIDRFSAEPARLKRTDDMVTTPTVKRVRSDGGFSSSHLRFLASMTGQPLSLHKLQTTVLSSVLKY
jgi:hypothetical protein